MRRFSALLLLVVFAGIGTGALARLHDLAHADEDEASHSTSDPLPRHDENNCPLHAALNAPMMAGMAAPALFLAAPLVGCIGTADAQRPGHAPVMHLACRGPPAAISI